VENEEKLRRFKPIAALGGSVSMAGIGYEQTVIPDRGTALDLIEAAVSTSDQQPLGGIVEQLLTVEHRDALSIMAVSRDEPDSFTQFLVLSEYYGLITDDEAQEYVQRFVAVSPTRAA